MEVHLNETESRFFAGLFIYCDVEKVGKIPILKAMELYRSANVQNDKIVEITVLAGIPSSALYISRDQFYSCLKLIAAYQSGMPLRHEIITAPLTLPLPRISLKDSPGNCESNISKIQQPSNGSNVIPPPPVAERKNSLPHRSNDWLVEAEENISSQKATISQQHLQKQKDVSISSDVPSTDSEIDQNESNGGANRVVNSESSGHEALRNLGSPEAWSTNSDSPTPTNSVTERQWTKETLWHGMLGDEHRQLLGTEEESSDRHSSEEENESDLESVYQITPEQRDYYYNQFKSVQRDNKGLLSGQVARVFFEKSRIPIEELRHIWQLCDVSRDGALSLAEFTAAMHLVVLRRNNIPLPTVLPCCLHPTMLQHNSQHETLNTLSQDPPEADLLHLNDDDEEDKTDNTVIVTKNATLQRGVTDKNITSINVPSTSHVTMKAGSGQGNQVSITPPLPHIQKSSSKTNSPIVESKTTPSTTVVQPNERNIWVPADIPPTQWTKFTESPTSNVSSPGPKPVNFDMQRTAQAVVSDPQILHPVPLRVTPVGNTITAAETINQDVHDLTNHQDSSPKQSSTAPTIGTSSNNTNNAGNVTLNREALQNNDLRAIQRPQAKKLIPKNIGALPPPPQRESSIGSATAVTSNQNTLSGVSACSADNNELVSGSQHQQLLPNKKDPPPLPPPRLLRHGRSSSLDLNKFKISAPIGNQPEMIAQKDTYPDRQQYSLPPAQPISSNTFAKVFTLPPTRVSLQQSNQRVSAFEVYRKPNTPRNSESPNPIIQKSYTAQPIQPTPPISIPFGAAGAAAIAQQYPLATALPNADTYEKRVNAITETLKHVSFKHENNMTDVLRHLREQNNILLRLCNDLSDELLSVQTRKEELRLKMDTLVLTESSAANYSQLQNQLSLRADSSNSAPVTANVTGGSGSSGVHSNV
ncbi:ralBP1-associated Eps domain-containing protein 1 isoform X3 [Ceratitis capitata]|uniref:ralBP1-associated Eps domain-containing protein 1 isoform X3 n=1 Tax=Ceratitis capitata TaxID=7213 RepID=UPI00032990C7|nr:ralBP1-associated Eps domain-containing protein 1 isoform X3 [Ceratitis capitata]